MKAIFYCREKVKLTELSKKSPRKIWNYIKKYKSKNKVISGASLNEFTQYFSSTSNSSTEHVNFHTSAREDIIETEALDSPISVNEIIKTISSLSRHKSCDWENIVAGF